MGIIPQCNHGMSIGLCRVCFPLPKKWSKNMDIKVGKYYKTRNEMKVRIYAIDGDSDYPIHGAILWEYGWDAVTWDKDGFCYWPEKECMADIISKWEE